jgi:hypothetical protein
MYYYQQYNTKEKLALPLSLQFTNRIPYSVVHAFHTVYGHSLANHTWHYIAINYNYA